MKKTLKLISVAVLALLSVLAMFAFAACNNGDDPDDGKADAGYFVIYAEYDGKKVNSIDGQTLTAQWCVHTDDGTGACSRPSDGKFDENGKARISIAALKNATKGDTFDSHILGLPAGYTYEENAAKYVVSESGTTVVTITITKA